MPSRKRDNDSWDKTVQKVAFVSVAEQKATIQSMDIMYIDAQIRELEQQIAALYAEREILLNEKKDGEGQCSYIC